MVSGRWLSRWPYFSPNQSQPMILTGLDTKGDGLWSFCLWRLARAAIDSAFHRELREEHGLRLPETQQGLPVATMPGVKNKEQRTFVYDVIF